MFTTSLTVAAVLGGLAANNLPAQPDWATSYGKALSLAAEQHKPVAVFITNGGLAHLTKGEGLGSDASKTLRTHYIAVQIDATTDAGKQMATAFGVTEGVVISDRSGEKIALRHAGEVASAALTGYLTKYAEQQTISYTENQSANAPAVAAPAPVYQPSFVYPSGGGCANGRCGQPSYQYFR